jgi:hypothetical protein
MMYSTAIFQSAGLNGNSALYATIGMGVINVIMTIISLVLVEKAGRRTLLLIGYCGMVVFLVLLTITKLLFVRTKTFFHLSFYFARLFRSLSRKAEHLTYPWLALQIPLHGRPMPVRSTLLASSSCSPLDQVKVSTFKIYCRTKKSKGIGEKLVV